MLSLDRNPPYFGNNISSRLAAEIKEALIAMHFCKPTKQGQHKGGGGGGGRSTMLFVHEESPGFSKLTSSMLSSCQCCCCCTEMAYTSLVQCLYMCWDSGRVLGASLQKRPADCVLSVLAMLHCNLTG